MCSSALPPPNCPSLPLSPFPHSYQRFQRNGTTFIVCGGGGITTDIYRPCAADTPEPLIFEPYNQFMEVYATAATLSLVSIDAFGVVIERKTVAKK